jgi:tetratricopeptide (TPR) repeat protein
MARPPHNSGKGKSILTLLGNVRNLRLGIFVAAALGKAAIIALDPPQLLSGKWLIIPAPYLISLTLLDKAFSAVILLELIRVIFGSTLSWSNKKHFVVAACVFAVLAVGQVTILLLKKGIEYYNYGWSLSDKEQYAAALPYLDIAVGLNPKDAYAYCERAYVYRRLHRFEEAIADSDRAIEINPRLSKAYEGRAYAYYHICELERATEDWKRAIVLDPNREKSLDPCLKAASEASESCTEP